MKIIKLIPFLLEKIWGTNQLKNFNFQIESNKKIGEAWVISAHDNGMSYFQAGQFAGQSLKDVFHQHPELFNYYQGEFPLLVKFINTNDFLPVHVHPTDNYAQKYNSLGKAEAWIILSAPKEAYLIYGHHAQSKKELEAMVNQGQWEKLLKKVPVQVGDFLYVEPGKLHSISPNMIIYEIQESSDMRYRLYDFNRNRELHIHEAIQCINVPDNQSIIISNIKNKIFSNKYFSIYLWDTKFEGQLIINENPYWLQFTIIDGIGKINDQKFKKGESAITLGELSNIYGEGNLKIIVSWINKP